MVTRCGFSKWYVIGVMLVSAVSADAKAAWGQENGANSMQQTIDAADRRIREIVRELARPGLSAKDRDRLIKEKTNQEWARSQAQWALYKEREERRRSSPDAVVAQFQAKLIAWKDASERWTKEWKNFERDLRIHQKDLDAHRQALAEFESRPPSRQSQFEVNQLNDWATRINDRLDKLSRWHQELEKKRVELVNRYNGLQAQMMGAR